MPQSPDILEQFAYIFAGLGLFFIGIKTIAENLKQLSGQGFRRLLAKITQHPSVAALLGTLSGAITQSTSAVTFIAISVIRSGQADVRQVAPLVAWANVGTSTLVMLASLHINLAILYLLGSVGFAYFFGLHEHQRYRQLLGTMLGVGLLFLGLMLIKLGAEPLKDFTGIEHFLQGKHTLIVSFLTGTIITLIVQSSATVSIIAVTMVAVGFLSLSQGLLLVTGASLGSGLSILLLSSNLKGAARHLALIQVMLKIIAALVTLPLLWLETHHSHLVSNYLQQTFKLNSASQVAGLYLILQLIAIVVYNLFSDQLYRLCQRFTPVDHMDELNRPKYLYAQGLEDTETATQLLEQEQVRLVKRLPLMLSSIRTDDVIQNTVPPEQLHASSQYVQQECVHFLSGLFTRTQSPETLEHLVNLHARNDLITNLQDTTLEFSQQLSKQFPEPAAQHLRHNLTESLHLILQLLADATENHNNDAELLMLSHDRNEVMERVRKQFITAESTLSIETQNHLFAATALFERQVWLVRRYALLLERRT